MFKQEKGITLVSLVITIIVMLILAGVSLSMVMGDSSVLDQATQAVDETERSTVSDEVSLAVGAVQTAYYGQYSNTTGRLTMAQCLITKLNKNDLTSAHTDANAVKLLSKGDNVNFLLVIKHKNENVYEIPLTVSTTSIKMEGVKCTKRSGLTNAEDAKVDASLVTSYTTTEKAEVIGY